MSALLEFLDWLPPEIPVGVMLLVLWAIWRGLDDGTAP